MHQDITGVILAGGKSRRFGVNKALLKIGDKTAIEIAADLMRSTFAENIICANSTEEYVFLELPIMADVFRDAGPLAGIHAALLHAGAEKVLIISCDLPLMSREMIEYLAGFRTDKQITITRAAGALQPFPGLYRKSLLPVAEEILTEPSAERSGIRRGHSVHALYDRIGPEIIDPSTLPFYHEGFYFNMNNPADYDRIAEIAATLPR